MQSTAEATQTNQISASEVAALESVRSGDQEAFTLIVREYQQRLYNYLYRFTHNKDDCEDLVSDTLFQAYSQLHTCRDLMKFRAWLFRIAHNLGINFWRKKSRERNATTRIENLTFEIVARGNSQEETSVNKEDGLLVERALRELPAHYRSALLLYYYEDFSYKEMTGVLGIPLSLVKTHLFRGRKMLEAKLMQYFAAQAMPVKYAGTVQKTAALQLEHDLSARIMKRVEEYQVARDYRRFVFTAMPLGAAAFSLIGYRWYTFVRVNSNVFSNIVDKFSDVSAWTTLTYWSSAFHTIRQSLPMVELSLFAINVAILAILVLKFRGMWRNPLATGRNVIEA